MLGSLHSTVGRITTAGAITEYVVGPANCNPYGITAGPDGALWFTELACGKIVRITTTGTVSGFAVTDKPASITAGPDGALWFTEYNGSRIGRITLDDVVTEYSLPSQPGGITAGPDGALWFTETNAIGRAPACGLGLRASLASGTLTLQFSLGTSTATTWYANMRTSTGGTQLWSMPIPAVAPPASFTRTLGPGFPDLGEVTIVSGLGAGPGAGLCIESASVNTAQ